MPSKEENGDEKGADSAPLQAEAEAPPVVDAPEDAAGLRRKSAGFTRDSLSVAHIQKSQGQLDFKTRGREQTAVAASALSRTFNSKSGQCTYSPAGREATHKSPCMCGTRLWSWLKRFLLAEGKGAFWIRSRRVDPDASLRDFRTARAQRTARRSRALRSEGRGTASLSAQPPT